LSARTITSAKLPSSQCHSRHNLPPAR